MGLIRIREQMVTADGFTARVSFEDETEYPITLRDPFSEADEQLLEWYFPRYAQRDEASKQKRATPERRAKRQDR